MMNLSVKNCHPQLQPYINAYIFVKAQSETEFSDNLFPLGEHFLIVKLRGEITFENLIKGSFQLPRIALLGHCNSWSKGMAECPLNVVAVQFKPYGGYALHDKVMHRLTNWFEDLGQERINENSLWDMLHLARTDQERADILDQYYLERLSAKRNTLGSLPEIVHLINQRNGAIAVKDLVDIFHTTERTLERIFLKAIGLSPKAFIRIARFNYVVRNVIDDRISLDDLMTNAGYYDQSHFIKDFVQFTRFNPSKFSPDKNFELTKEHLKMLMTG